MIPKYLIKIFNILLTSGHILTQSFTTIFYSNSNNGKVKLLTKGDNNKEDDSKFLYQNWLEGDNVVGKAKFLIPYVGMPVAIISNFIFG